ncbi:MAG: S8 family peptidase [Chloroflexi bacterium]|nr:S8 family peptidase [Chloroflexota bacterium]
MRLEKWFKPFVIVLVAASLLLGPLAILPMQSQAASPEKISPDLRALVASNASDLVPVIVQMNTASSASTLAVDVKPELKAKGKIRKQGGVPAKSLGIVEGASGLISVSRLAALSADPDVRYISRDVALRPTGSPYSGDMVDYARALKAQDVWEKGISGSGVTVAVLDSGVVPSQHGIDKKRILASVDLVAGSQNYQDPGGHGTHVAGIIAGQDADWSGVAPQANIVSVRVIGDTGSARMSTVIQGIQWAVQNRKKYGIRVINLSLGAPANTSYTMDPLSAAVELAWHAGIVVVSSAGNAGPNARTISTPGHDPYVVTVGATDMNATVSRDDDTLTPFSSRGPTLDGLTKPDVVAPGRKMVSTRVAGSYLDTLYPDRVVNKDYFRLTGTSQAAAAVSGVAALVLSANPGLTPDQVKQQLMASASKLNGYDANAVGAGYVDAARAVNLSPTIGNQMARPADAFAALVFPLIKGKSNLVWKDLTYHGGVDSRGIPWSNITWDNVAWDNVTWDNVAWDNVAWDNVAWDNVAWDNVAWDNVAWDNVAWDNVAWDNVAWDSAGRLD